MNDNFLDAYADTARRIGTVVYGAFCGPEMFASAELRALHALGDEMAEAAFAVEKAHRHLGLGSALMDRIITAAQNRGIDQLHMICVRENQPHAAPGRKSSARISGSTTARHWARSRPARHAPSLLDEAMHDTTDFVTAVLDWSPDFPGRHGRHPGIAVVIEDDAFAQPVRLVDRAGQHRPAAAPAPLLPPRPGRSHKVCSSDARTARLEPRHDAGQRVVAIGMVGMEHEVARRSAQCGEILVVIEAGGAQHLGGELHGARHVAPPAG